LNRKYFQTSIQISPTGRAELHELADSVGVSKAHVINFAILQLATDRLPRSSIRAAERQAEAEENDADDVPNVKERD
jgi:hypothetical protein